MTNVSCKTKLRSVVRSSLHPCPENWEAIGLAVVYYARAAHLFSTGIECRNCMQQLLLITSEHLLLVGKNGQKCFFPMRISGVFPDNPVSRLLTTNTRLSRIQIRFCLSLIPLLISLRHFQLNYFQFLTTVDSQKIVQGKFCEFTENQFLQFLTLRIGCNMECQLYT